MNTFGHESRIIINRSSTPVSTAGLNPTFSMKFRAQCQLLWLANMSALWNETVQMSGWLWLITLTNPPTVALPASPSPFSQRNSSSCPLAPSSRTHGPGSGRPRHHLESTRGSAQEYRVRTSMAVTRGHSGAVPPLLWSVMFPSLSLSERLRRVTASLCITHSEAEGLAAQLRLSNTLLLRMPSATKLAQLQHLCRNKALISNLTSIATFSAWS